RRLGLDEAEVLPDRLAGCGQDRSLLCPEAGTQRGHSHPLALERGKSLVQGALRDKYLWADGPAGEWKELRHVEPVLLGHPRKERGRRRHHLDVALSKRSNLSRQIQNLEMDPERLLRKVRASIGDNVVIQRVERDIDSHGNVGE